MSDTAISVRGLSKRYRLGVGEKRRDSIREQIVDGFSSSFRRISTRFTGRLEHLTGEEPRDDEFWALRDVSFDVRAGETLGIIGSNGAGKSTILKILSQITKPTEGRIRIKGRVGSLLEVGTGFHPELTGRENIYLNGAILGMHKREIQHKFDEIVAFAGIEKFLDTPVKRYSSGMYVRLAFAVAAHLEPEILLVDEVLAVGDATFQKRCLGKMGDVSKEGRTVLFVSHNMTALQSLCPRALWIGDGRVVEDGPSDRIVPMYLRPTHENLTEQVWDDVATAPGNDKVRLRRAALLTADDSPVDEITVQTPLVLEFEYWNLVPETRLNLSVFLINEADVRVFNTIPIREPIWHGRPFPKGLFRSRCLIPGDLLNDGSYRVQLLVVEDQSAVISRHDDLLSFDVNDLPELRAHWFGKWEGALRPKLTWQTELVSAEPLNPTGNPQLVGS